MAIRFHFEDIPVFSINKQNTTSWIKNTASLYGKKTGDINYIFCSDERILEINNQYLSHDYYTDIITFDYTENNSISGDLFISVDTISSNAEKYDVSFNEELYRVIIHGILHLCGQNDKTPSEQDEMTIKENLALDEWNKLTKE